jgi:hypothetical protein
MTFFQRVSDSEMKDFSSWQGNQGPARRRTPYVAQAAARIDAARSEKNRFRTETKKAAAP